MSRLHACALVIPEDERETWCRYILSHSAPDPHSGCRLWTAARTTNFGYGKATYKDKTVRAHRLSYAAFHGPLAAGEVVRHNCDQPLCVEPGCLLKGTQQDNMQDAISRGRLRALYGEENPNARLTTAQVIVIRRLLALGHTRRGLARQFGVNNKTIRRIAQRHLWKHIPEEEPHAHHRPPR